MKADAIVIGNVLQNRTRFAVPIYQRHYVWKRKEQWEPFWLDIRTKAIERLDGRERRFSHYMGAIVLESQRSYSVKRVQSFQIIDGQQRLTTFALFLAAARDYALTISRSDTAANISRYLLNSDPQLMEDPDVEIFKVWPTHADRDIFRDIIQFADRAKLRAKYAKYFYATRDKIYDYSTTPKMLGAYGYFFDHIKGAVETDDLDDELSVKEEPDTDAELAGATENSESESENTLIPRELKLDAIWQALVEEFKLVEIVLEEGDDAQVIFETLNGRGEPLLAADLVRNNIFHRAAETEDPDQLFKSQWAPFEDQFWEVLEKQGRYKKPRIEFFIANYIASQISAEVNLSKLFSEYKAFLFRDRRKTPRFQTVSAELANLSNYGTVYRDLIERTGETILARFSRRLLPWDVTTVFPLVLRIFATNEIAEDDKQKMLNVVMSFIVRRAVCGLTTKNYNKFFLSVIAELDRSGWRVETLVSFFKKQTSDTGRWPNDEEFENKWLASPMYTTLGSGRTRAILEEIERAKRGKFQEVTELASGLTVEHVLPNSWNTSWPLQDGTSVSNEDISTAMFYMAEDETRAGKIARRNRLKHSVGNLTLLTQPLNSSVSSGPFTAKRASLSEQSVLVMNKEIVNEEEWNESRIEARSMALLSVARQLWPHAL